VTYLLTLSRTFIPAGTSRGHVLDSKQIHEQFHDDSDSFSEFSQDSDVDIFDHIDPDAKMSGPDLSDSVVILMMIRQVQM
jgi:hypothetical protein